MTGFRSDQDILLAPGLRIGRDGEAVSLGCVVGVGDLPDGLLYDLWHHVRVPDHEPAPAAQSLRSLQNVSAFLARGQDEDVPLTGQKIAFQSIHDMLFDAESAAAAIAGDHGADFRPGPAYLDLVAALQAKFGDVVVGEVHGWPILSVVLGSPTVTEAAGESIPGGGGAQAPDSTNEGEAA